MVRLPGFNDPSHRAAGIAKMRENSRQNIFRRVAASAGMIAEILPCNADAAGGESPGFFQENGDVFGFGTRALRVERMPTWLCRLVIKARHYSGTIVQNATLHLGVFRGRDLVGVMQFGYAMNPNSGRSVVEGTANDEYLELNRLWIHDDCPRNTESRVLSFAFTLIRRIRSKVRWIQSFADERCGCGVVYQAANFLYVGSHLTTFYRLDGSWYHDMLLTTGKKDKSPRSENLRANVHRAEKFKFRQFRYIFFLRQKYRAGLRFKVQPFPKPRGEGFNGETPRFHRGKKGSIPLRRSTRSNEVK